MQPPTGMLKSVLSLVAVCVIALLVVVGLWVGYKTVHRSQVRADANNRVKVTAINIRNARQQAHVVEAQTEIVKAKAEQRYQESIGIRRAQDEIAKTLTPLYIQHEAIQAQERMAVSGKNNTSIYIPSGVNGVPMVNDVSQHQSAGEASP